MEEMKAGFMTIEFSTEGCRFTLAIYGTITRTEVETGGERAWKKSE